MAHPCPVGDGYHINAELLALEVVDPQTGSPSPPGEIGKVLVPDRPGNGLSWNKEAVKHYGWNG